MNASKEKIKAINAILVKTGQMENKAAIVSNATNNRTSHSSQLLMHEADALLSALQSSSKTKKKPSQKMVNKLFAMAHEMGWVTESVVVRQELNPELTPEGAPLPGSNYRLKTKKDYSRVYNWVLKYGWKQKPLSEYTYEELPKLISIFEYKVYKPYIANIK